MTRCLLLIDPQQYLSASLAKIEQAGWQIYSLPSIKFPIEFPPDCAVKVGIITVNHHDFPQALSTIQHLFSDYAHIQWVTIFSKELLNHHSFCELIADQIYDYQILPIDIDRVIMTIGHAYGIANLSSAHVSLEHDQNFSDHQWTMIGQTPAMKKLFTQIRKVALSDAPVLISGESGTGKELAAHAIHENSNRAQNAFFAVNCGAIPADLIQAELFGYEKGAFTGAVARKIGCIETADQGTLFLDEITELPFQLQVNLLRFLQEGTIRRLGDVTDRKVNVRVIAATNINLEEAVKVGKFREDLYYRIHVLNLHIPPLRERHQDIELLAKYILYKFCHEKNKKIKGFSKAAIQAMETHFWQGNVREMINRIRTALVMCEHALITPLDLKLNKPAITPTTLTLAQVRDEAEKTAIQNALKLHHYQIQNTAKALGVSRVTLYRLMEKFQIGKM